MSTSSESNNVSRRSFVQTAAATGAAVVAAAQLAGCASGSNGSKTADVAGKEPAAKAAPAVHVAGTDRIKIGLIGCGGRGRGAALDAAHASPAAVLVAMGDAFKDHLDTARTNLATLGAQYAVKDDRCHVGLDAYQHVINSDVDLVILTTPPGFRPLHYKAAINAGKHVFFEKPVAVDPAGCRAIIEMSEVAEKKKLAVVTGTLFRHQDWHKDIINRIHDGQIGDVVAMQSYYNVGGLWMFPRQTGWSDLEWQLRNWLYFPWLSGDHIVEQAVHRIDIMNWVMRSCPTNAYGMGGRQVRTEPAYGNIYDHFAVEYEYPNGAKVEFMCRQIDGCDSRVTQTVVGTKGVAAPMEGWITGEKPYRLKGKPNNGYVEEWKDLINSIQIGKPLNEGRQIAESSLTGIMGRMSAYTGKNVTWEHAMTSKLDLWPKETLDWKMKIAVPPVPVPGKEPLV